MPVEKFCSQNNSKDHTKAYLRDLRWKGLLQTAMKERLLESVCKRLSSIPLTAPWSSDTGTGVSWPMTVCLELSEADIDLYQLPSSSKCIQIKHKCLPQFVSPTKYFLQNLRDPILGQVSAELQTSLLKYLLQISIDQVLFSFQYSQIWQECIHEFISTTQHIKQQLRFPILVQVSISL